MNAYPSVKQSFGLLGIVIGLSLVMSPLYILGQNTIGREATFLFYYLLTIGGTLYAALMIRQNKDGLPVTFDFKITYAKAIPLIALTLLGLLFGLITPLLALMPVNDFYKEIFQRMFGDIGPLTFIAIVIAAPVMEELLFRGIILDGFLKRYSPLKAIVVSSALFGLFHLNPWQFVSAFILGSFIGWIYYRTRSISLAILLHLLNNLIAFITAATTDSLEESFDQSLTEYYGGTMPMFTVIGISLGVALYGLIELDRMLEGAPPENFPPHDQPFADVVITDDDGHSHEQADNHDHNDN